jgi:hypothetical protein
MDRDRSLGRSETRVAPKTVKVPFWGCLHKKRNRTAPYDSSESLLRHHWSDSRSRLTIFRACLPQTERPVESLLAVTPTMVHHHTKSPSQDKTRYQEIGETASRRLGKLSRALRDRPPG